jgi:hypothetical protein
MQQSVIRIVVLKVEAMLPWLRPTSSEIDGLAHVYEIEFSALSLVLVPGWLSPGPTPLARRIEPADIGRVQRTPKSVEYDGRYR